MCFLFLHFLFSKIDAEYIQKKSLNEKIRILPGAIFKLDNTNLHAIRLGFGNLNNSELAVGVERLKRSLTKH